MGKKSKARGAKKETAVPAEVLSTPAGDNAESGAAAAAAGEDGESGAVTAAAVVEERKSETNTSPVAEAEEGMSGTDARTAATVGKEEKGEAIVGKAAPEVQSVGEGRLTVPARAEAESAEHDGPSAADALLENNAAGTVKGMEPEPPSARAGFADLVREEAQPQPHPETSVDRASSGRDANSVPADGAVLTNAAADSAGDGDEAVRAKLMEREQELRMANVALEEARDGAALAREEADKLGIALADLQVRAGDLAARVQQLEEALASAEKMSGALEAEQQRAAKLAEVLKSAQEQSAEDAEASGARIAQLEDKVLRREEMLRSSNEQVVSLRENVRVAISERAQMEEQLDKLVDEVARANSRIVELTSEAEQHVKQHSDAAREVSDLRDSLAALEDKVAKAQREEELLKSKNEELEATLAKRSDALATAEAQHRAETSKLTEQLDATSLELTKTLEGARARAEKLEAQIERLTEELSRVSSTMPAEGAASEDAFSQTLSENARLKTELEAARDEMRRANSSNIAAAERSEMRYSDQEKALSGANTTNKGLQADLDAAREDLKREQHDNAAASALAQDRERLAVEEAVALRQSVLDLTKKIVVLVDEIDDLKKSASLATDELFGNTEEVRSNPVLSGTEALNSSAHSTASVEHALTQQESRLKAEFEAILREKDAELQRESAAAAQFKADSDRAGEVAKGEIAEFRLSVKELYARISDLVTEVASLKEDLSVAESNLQTSNERNAQLLRDAEDRAIAPAPTPADDPDALSELKVAVLALRRFFVSIRQSAQRSSTAARLRRSLERLLPPEAPLAS